MRPRTLLEILPVAMALAVVAWYTADSVLGRLFVQGPISPWEGGLLLEGVRSLRGLPVYEPAATGHATSMYGPLYPHALAQAYRIFGVDLLVGRLLSLAAMTTLVVVVTRAVLRERSRWLFAAGVILLGGAYNKALAFGAEGRPDMLAHLLGGLGLVGFYQGWERRSPGAYAAGVLAMVLGFLFKQTTALAALVPLVAISMDRRASLRARLAWALIPSAAVGACVVAIAALLPNVFHYAIWLPRQYTLLIGAYPAYLFGLVTSCLLFVWTFLDRLHGGERRRDPLQRWLLAALAVTIPGAVLFVSKVGGSANSIYPALLAMLGFCLHHAPAMVRRSMALSLPRRIFVSCGVAALILASTLPLHPIYQQSLHYPTLPLPPYVVRWAPQSGQGYAEVTQFVRELPGRVASLDDPTIPYFASGTLGRVKVFEMDNAPVDGRYSRQLPAYVLEDLWSADWVVVSSKVFSPYPQTSKLVDLDSRFRLHKAFGPYRVWAQRQPSRHRSRSPTPPPVQ